MSKHKPKYSLRVGCINVAVWEKARKSDVVRNTTIDKSYKQGEEWKKTKSYKVADIPKIILGLERATEYLFLEEAKTIYG